MTRILCLAFVGLFNAYVFAQSSPTAAIDKMMQEMLHMSAEQRAQLRAVEVPINAEKEFGDWVFEAFQQQLKLQKIAITNRGRDAKYLTQLVGRIKPLMDNRTRYPRIQVHIVDSPEIDARSAPGGTLVFYRGLLEFAESEAALVGIIGHELSHLDRRHQLKPLQQQQLAKRQLAGSVKQGFDLNRMFDFGKISFGSYHPIHPEEEAEADHDAVRWMYELGYDPTELAKLFDQLANRGQGPAQMMPAFLRSHPLMQDRSLTVLRLADQLQRQKPIGKLVVGSDALKDRIPAAIK
jgi:predicted Zn-dependent protease